MLLGHVIQIAHIGIVMLVIFFIPLRLWVGPIWFLGALLAQSFCGGDCPITVLSNKFFIADDAHPYRSMVSWLADVVGNIYVAVGILTVFTLVPFALGCFVRLRRNK